MIRPTIYSFNAPYRGPKASREINKLFTSICFDLSTLASAITAQEEAAANNLSSCIETGVPSGASTPSAGTIDGQELSFASTNTLYRYTSEMDSRIDKILEDLQGGTI